MSTKEVWAPGQDASWMPPTRDVLGKCNWLETLEETQNMLEGLHIHILLGTPRRSCRLLLGKRMSALPYSVSCHLEMGICQGDIVNETEDKVIATTES